MWILSIGPENPRVSFILPFLFKARAPKLKSRWYVTLDGCLKFGTWRSSIAPRTSESHDQKPGETERVPQRLALALRRAGGLEFLSVAAAPSSFKAERETGEDCLRNAESAFQTVLSPREMPALPSPGRERSLIAQRRTGLPVEGCVRAPDVLLTPTCVSARRSSHPQLRNRQDPNSGQGGNRSGGGGGGSTRGLPPHPIPREQLPSLSPSLPPHPSPSLPIPPPGAAPLPVPHPRPSPHRSVSLPPPGSTFIAPVPGKDPSCARGRRHPGPPGPPHPVPGSRRGGYRLRVPLQPRSPALAAFPTPLSLPFLLLHTRDGALRASERIYLRGGRR